jgi:hypothetical protein
MTGSSVVRSRRPNISCGRLSCRPLIRNSCIPPEVMNRPTAGRDTGSADGYGVGKDARGFRPHLIGRAARRVCVGG